MQNGRKCGKVMVIVLLVVLFSLSLSAAESSSMEKEIQRLTYYAQEYEIGNINYAQFSVYLGSVRESLSLALGAEKSNEGSILEAAELEATLGRPTEKTEWVWVEKEDREIRMEKEIPAWRKVIFDGNKIQIRLNAWPHLLRVEDKDVRYRLNNEIVFKRQEIAFNPQEAITKVKQLAETYNSEQTQENADVLAKESVLTEARFRELLERNPDKCENTIQSFLGSEAQRREQEMFRKEITLYEGKNYEGMLILESCENCEWQWINLNAYVNTHGRNYIGEQDGQAPNSQARDAYKDLTDTQFKEEIKATVEAMKKALEERKSIREYETKLRALNEAWNERSNTIQEEIEQRFREKREALPAVALQNYNWKGEEDERRALEQSLRKTNYEERVRFYKELFLSYPMKEQYIEEQNFERRLVENSKTVTLEMCSNQKDDDNDNEVDCEDSQCSGSWCGSKEINITYEGGNYTVRRDLYCVQKICQLKSDSGFLQPHELKQNKKQSCLQHPSITCSGIVLFGGQDANQCPLPPVCVEKKTVCSSDADCVQPRCGIAACSEGICKVANLETCREKLCNDGEQQMQQCASGESFVIAFCADGVWQSTQNVCEKSSEDVQKTPEQPSEKDKDSSTPQCIVREDCSENEVCSNSHCVPLPNVQNPEQSSSETAPSESESNQEQTAPEQESAPTKEKPVQEPVPAESFSENTAASQHSGNMITGAVIASWKFMGQIVGRVIDNSESESNATSEVKPEKEKPASEANNTPNVSVPPEPQTNTTESGKMNESRSEQEIRDEQNESSSEPVLKSQPRERNESEKENNKSYDSREQPREESHTYQEQLGVFQVFGSCRQTKDRLEANINFGGWGKPFEKIEPLKQQYYDYGQEWCKREYDNILTQRQEFEKSFNEEFAEWFFQDYLANSADEWESHMSGIFDLYWRDIEISRQLSDRLNCLNLQSLPSHTLLNFTYETEYADREFWVEKKHTKINPNDEKEVDLISPYMRIFIFPPKNFIMYEFQQAMENRKFPGPAEEREERENEEGLTEEEKQQIRKDTAFMKKLRKAVEPYDGQMDASVQLFDTSTQTVIFNLYVQVNENDIMKLQPMPPEDQPEQDVVIRIDFDRAYALMDFVKREMEGGQLESPPWDKKPRRVTDTAKEMYNGIKIWLRVQGIINDLTVTPERDEQQMKSFMKSVIWEIMTKSSDDKNQERGAREEEKN